MSNELNPKTGPDQPIVYQVRLQGHLGRRWADWLGGEATIISEDHDQTLLTCSVVDQAALYGLLRKVRDLGLPLISVSAEPGPADDSDLSGKKARTMGPEP